MRGLKRSDWSGLYTRRPLSHLLQMRGLKRWQPRNEVIPQRSHLLQMRGLKRYWRRRTLGRYRSRIFYRCVDWNNEKTKRMEPILVASFTDAWIETMLYKTFPQNWQSRIFYRCVDWNRISPRNPGAHFSRIFYRCVDWNSAIVFWNSADCKSHLLQMRGLKQIKRLYRVNLGRSRIFYRCVDWNVLDYDVRPLAVVASFTDAWIETFRYVDVESEHLSHLLQMRGLKHPVNSLAGKW